MQNVIDDFTPDNTRTSFDDPRLRSLPMYSPDWLNVRYPEIGAFVPCYPRPISGPMCFHEAMARFSLLCTELGQRSARATIEIVGLGNVSLRFQAHESAIATLAFVDPSHIKSVPHLLRSITSTADTWIKNGCVHFGVWG
jgi:hypothetical protein